MYVSLLFDIFQIFRLLDGVMYTNINYTRKGADNLHLLHAAEPQPQHRHRHLHPREAEDARSPKAGNHIRVQQQQLYEAFVSPPSPSTNPFLR